MDLLGQRVLVTGADGFIGSHLAEACVQAGARVRALTWYDASGRRGWLDDTAANLRADMEVVATDIRDAESVRQAVRDCDLVLHLAALIGIPYSYEAPRSYVDTNITGTLNVLTAAREHGARVVHTSTSEVYGTARTTPMSEDHPLVGQSPYAASKIGADQMALSFHRAFDLPVTVVRPFNTYGPRQSTRAVIPTIISQVAAGNDTIKLGATAPTRDFLFVEDTVNGFLAAAKSPHAAGGTFNLGTGFEISIGDLAGLIGSVMERDFVVVADDERFRPDASEVDRLVCDASRAREHLGWYPQFSGRDGLRAGLQRTIAWLTAGDRRHTHDAATYAR